LREPIRGVRRLQGVESTFLRESDGKRDEGEGDGIYGMEESS
jgi:hypothetical protein